MREPKIILLTAMHGRHYTVINCINKSPNIERYIVYSTDQDGEFLKRIGEKNIIQHKNNPLNEKWNAGLSYLKDVDFDAVILAGSDDYFDTDFLNFAKDNCLKYDMIAFKDMYFEQDGAFYYWKGYNNHRKGEPAGAGKIYSKKFLNKIKYNLFPTRSDKGLDGQSWTIVNFMRAKTLVTTLKENGLFLCDVKDGQGITPLHSIGGLERIYV